MLKCSKSAIVWRWDRHKTGVFYQLIRITEVCNYQVLTVLECLLLSKHGFKNPDITLSKVNFF